MSLRRRDHWLSEGVTLIELVIAIAVLGILLAAGLPSFGNWIQNSRTRAQAESILRGLQLARQEAIRNNSPVEFQFVAGGWRVGCVTVTTECPLDIQSYKTPAGSVVVNSGGQQNYRFDNMGFLTVPVVAQGNVWTTIAVTNPNLVPPEGRDLSILITSGGATKMCDPQVTDVTDFRFCAV
ncbi:MAG: prepilin-type N-terminal cleavage/methylation domain-containing protein [Oxalobacter sp.]|nr:MAG: prepilin-type N-terminal cleavage/methylation domain-containing protein [Oxalobacter sp.]